MRGPITVLKDLWSNPEIGEDNRDVYQYIIDLRTKLDKCARLAYDQSKLSQEKFSSYFDLKARSRQLSVGDEALVLLPDCHNKLLVCWRGPFKVIQKLNKVNYVLDCNGTEKVYHINLLKKYFRRQPQVLSNSIDSQVNVSFPCSVLFLSHTPVIDESTLDVISNNSQGINFPKLLDVDYFDDSPSSSPEISKELSSSEVKDLKKLMVKFSGVFSDSPGYTNTVTHKIELKTTAPICSKMYPVPVHLRKVFDDEVDSLLSQGIIERSISEYRSPPLLIKKPDDSYRMTIDYRGVNCISRSDAEPAFNIDDDIHRFKGSNYYSELDICKAYYQIELDESSRPYTAFPTSKGLMQWTRLPFGLNTACQTYARLMRIVLEGVPNTAFYFDNILVFTESWHEHIEVLSLVLSRLRLHGLTAKPGKCHIGFSSIQYLGYKISKDFVSPVPDKVSALSNLNVPPTTKKGLRSFLGFISYYRKFVNNLAFIVAPLNELIKSKVSEPLKYSSEQIDSFNNIKEILSAAPILHLPDLTIPFIVRSDSSATGIGGVLLQMHDDVTFPVSYASRQLTCSERKYSTVERECLAIVFAIQRFSLYLIGKKFLLEVDHRPLVYLSKMKNLNSRLARWALCLQPYDYSIVYLPGSDNVGADFFSRCG